MTVMKLPLLALVFSSAEMGLMIPLAVMNYVRMFISSKYLPSLPMREVSSLHIDSGLAMELL